MHSPLRFPQTGDAADPTDSGVQADDPTGDEGFEGGGRWPGRPLLNVDIEDAVLENIIFMPARHTHTHTHSLSLSLSLSLSRLACIIVKTN
jgi:hypothetical protein